MSNKPTTITASEFVAGGYAEKIARGECVVRDMVESELVVMVEKREKRIPEGIVYSHTYTDGSGREWGSLEDNRFDVEWLPTDRNQQAVSDPSTVSRVRPTDVDSDVAALQASLAQMTSERDALREEVRQAQATAGDFQTKWFSVAKQLAELRVDYDELERELEALPVANEPDHK